MEKDIICVNEKSYKKIWRCQKKVVPLHSQSGETHLSGVVIGQCEELGSHLVP